MRFELKNYKDKEGLSIVRLVLVQGSIKRRIHTELKIESKYFQNKVNSWIKRSHPNHIFLNNYLAGIYKKHASVDIFKKPLDFDGALELYWNNKRVDGLAENSIAKIKTSLNDWKRFLIHHNKLKLSILSYDRQLVGQYFIFLLEHGNKRSTANHKVKDLNAMLNFLKNSLDVIPYNPVEGVRFKNVGNAIKQVLTIDQINQLIEYEPEAKLEKLGKELWLISFNCKGLRVSDLVLLKKTNYIAEEGKEFISLLTQKTGIPIKVEVNEPLRKLLNSYRKEESEYLIDLGQRNDSMREVDRINASIRKGLKQISAKLNIGALTGIHTARSAFAQIANQLDTPVQHIQKALGHTKVSTTELYLERLTPDAQSELVVRVLNRVNREN